MPERFNFESNQSNPKTKKENLKIKERIEIRENAEKINTFIEKISEKLKEEGVPVNTDCRINMNPFRKAFGFKEKDVIEHKRYIKKKEKEFCEDLTGEEKREKEEEKITIAGERFERLKTAILYKAFKEKFIVVRSSLYDDIRNGVDNVIVEKETGNVICAMDEITTNEKNTASRFENKKEDAERKNIEEGGAKLEYGISVKEGKIIKKKIGDIPVLCVSIDQETLKKTERSFISPFDKKGEIANKEDKSPNGEYKRSEEEEKFISDFFDSSKKQIDSLDLNRRLNPDLRKNLLLHKKAFENLEDTIKPAVN